jgi:hypothetical protein
MHFPLLSLGCLTAVFKTTFGNMNLTFTFAEN